MDQGDGRFAPVPDVIADVLRKFTGKREVMTTMTTEDVEALWPRLFMVGAEVEVRKSRFRIEYIGTDVLLLKLLPKE